MFKFSLSKIFTRTVEDDLEKISLSRNKNIFSDTFPKEVLINIVSFMELGTIYSFSRTDRYLLKLLFDQTPERIDKLNKLRKSHKKSQLDFLTTKNAVEEYEKEEHSQQQFELIQKLIWKPLCPLRFENLIFEGMRDRYCSTCNKHVYLVQTSQEMTLHISQGHCIAFVRDESNMLMGEFILTDHLTL
nr:unnamed protein product [Naegleria fowleri]